jgi:hypothetical protein
LSRWSVTRRCVTRLGTLGAPAASSSLTFAIALPRTSIYSTTHYRIGVVVAGYGDSAWSQVIVSVSEFIPRITDTDFRTSRYSAATNSG